MSVIVRGSRVYFSFVFYDVDGNTVDADSAELQLTYPGLSDFETVLVSMTEEDGAWLAEWDSALSRPGWVAYHAHAVADDDALAVDGRFRLSGNRANLDHDPARSSGTLSSSAMARAPAHDYGQ